MLNSRLRRATNAYPRHWLVGLARRSLERVRYEAEPRHEERRRNNRGLTPGG